MCVCCIGDLCVIDQVHLVFIAMYYSYLRSYLIIQVEEFKFLTRLHYWAADTVTHGKKR
jgi:hypothetical protein